ncbi:MAG TPA: NUDIX hydrolase, partial [Terriglobia bacterium]|nr:NUDIX hydrolase [Terriglobia bacterium]
FQVTVDRILEPGGIKARREVVRHGGSVVVLPRLDDGRVLLVRQFRYPAGEALWELVAGGIEPGETPAKAATRELLEETGCRARSFKPILRFFPSPGFLTEEMHLIEAAGLTKGRAKPEEDERIRTRAFTQAELEKMIDGRRIKDGKTLVGLLWFFQRRTAR